MNNLVSIVKAQADLVFVHGDRTSTTTQIIAEAFGKRHDHVLRAVRSLECSPGFNRLNYGGAEYIDEKGETRPMFEVTRDGFMFLAMGFTGPRAAAVKEAFIAEFNRMEAALKAGETARIARAELETARLMRRLIIAQRQLIASARRELRALKAAAGARPAAARDWAQFELELPPAGHAAMEG